MKKLLLLFCFLFFFKLSSAQYFSWANRQPGVDYAHQSCMALDAQSNVYITGWFQNTVDFDPDTGVFSLTAYSGDDDIFLAKYDAAGKFKWAYKFGGGLDDHGMSVKVDNAGNVLMAALFRITCDFDPSGNVANVSSNGQRDFAIAKFDSAGNFIWVKSFGSIDNEAKIQIDVDALNNVYSVGNFSSTVDFDPSATNTFNITTVFGEEIFISKLDSNGNFVWAKSIESGSGIDEANAMDVDNYGNVYFTGRADGGTSVDYDPGPAVYNLPYSLWDPFVEKLDSAGNFSWVKPFIVPGLNTGIGQAIHCDENGNVLSAGQFFGSIDLNPEISIPYYINSAGQWDTYISKLDSAGNFIWGKAIGGAGKDYAYAMTTDLNNNIYISGQFEGICDFNPDTNSVYNIQSNGFNSPDMYNLKLDSAGNFLWAFNIGGNYTDVGNSIAVDNQNNIFINGRFGGTVDFDPDTNAVYNLTSSSYYNLFLMKLSQCQPVYSTINTTTCDSFSYNGSTYYSSGTYNHHFQSVKGCDSTVSLNLTIANNDTIVNQDACQSFFYNGQTYYTSGTYYGTFTNSFGCDSNVTLNLNLTTIDTTIWQSGLLLQSNENQSGVTYQWIDCNTGALMPFANSQYFLPTDPGSYGVILTYNGCVDTSECVTVTDAGIKDYNLQNAIQIYPNPTSGIFNLICKSSFSNCAIEIYNNLGALIFSDAMKNQIDLTISQTVCIS